MIWLKLAWGFVTGNIGTIANVVAGVVGKLSDNQTAQTGQAMGAETAVQMAQIQAAAAAWHDRASLFGGMRIIQWLILVALAPPLAHEGLVFIDSLCWGLDIHGVARGCQLGIPRLPAVYEEREWALITSLLGIQTGVVGVGSFLRWLHK
jgi:hypothetical protein